MTPTFLYDVFLSHSSKDKHIVRPIAERLKNEGLKVWFDEWSLSGDGNIQEQIEEGLEQSRVLVFCMSANAFGSDWAQLENQTFRFRDPLNKERRFIPLRLDDTPLKGSLAQFQHIKWGRSNQQDYSKLIEACAPTENLERQNLVSAEKVIRLDHDKPLGGCSFSSDGRLVLTGSWDGNVRLWDLETSRCLRVLKGHTSIIDGVEFNADGQRALSGSHDRTVRLWNPRTGKCLRILKGHTSAVWSMAWSQNQRQALSSGKDGTVRLWDLASGKCLRVFESDPEGASGVVWSPDGRQALVGGQGDAPVLRLWDIKSGRCVQVFEGHLDYVSAVYWSQDQRRAISCSGDKTIRLWSIENGRCLRVLEGHTEGVNDLALIAGDRYVLSGGRDRTLRLWDIETGACLTTLDGHTEWVNQVAWRTRPYRAFSRANEEIRVWDLSKFITKKLVIGMGTHDSSFVLDQIQYTNAKVLLVGDSGAGKTGLTERLSQDSFTPSYSTSGTWSTQWQMQDLPTEAGWEREVWLWDFGGQADQRLIHQLYLDKTALVLLVFNSDRDTVLPALREWQQALQRSIPSNTQTILVAGRTDVGRRFDRERVMQFAKHNGFEFFETSAQSGTGCDELRKAIQTSIKWNLLEKRTSPIVFKFLRDEIIELRDKGNSLLTFKELRELLRQRMPVDVQFTDGELETVLNLLDGPGVVKELNFGTYILLRPEWLNIYAQAVIRTLKSARTSLGCLPVQSIAKGELVFQTTQADGKVVDEKRLKPHEETIVLQAMEQALLERKLCLREEGQLVFPSYYGLEQPSGPIPPKYFISYTFGGFLDDVYATLVVRLAYCGAFQLKELWRDAADFETLAEKKKMGVKLLRKEDGSGELLVHFEKGVAPQEQVIFATYIHDHLKEKASSVTRLRFYVCPNCDTPVKNREVAMKRLEDDGEKAKIICVDCEKYISLWDSLEKRFASESVQKEVALLHAQENQELDSRRKGKLLALEVMARITSADQKCFEVPGVEDEGLDIEVEFTDDDGRGTGKRIYLQLKAGNSYLQRRKADGAEIFRIKKQSWVKYWLKQTCPVLLVIGSFPERTDERRGTKERFADIRWMEISDLLRRESKNGIQPVKQIVFKGERLDTLSVRRLRERVLTQ